MNHIHKVIFNQATGTFAAVTETAKGLGKKSSRSTGKSTTVGSLKKADYDRANETLNNRLKPLLTVFLSIIATLPFWMVVKVLVILVVQVMMVALPSPRLMIMVAMILAVSVVLTVI